MAIPDFQAIMLPLLKLTVDGVLRTSAELRELLADRFGLTERELAELLPSGRAPLFANRVAWASFYLRKAGLLQRPQRGRYQITDRGREVLKSSPERIDIRYLEDFPDFREFRAQSTPKEKPESTSERSDTPEEILEAAYQRLRGELAQELLAQVKGCTPRFFENLVVELLVRMGYGGSRRDAGMAVGQAGDEGIDGIIKEDRLGLDVIYLQAKKWEGTVSRPEIQKFVGALHGKHAKKGVFITTGTFSQSSIDYAATIDSKVVLIDGQRLAQLMIDFNLGVSVSTDRIYEIKRLDTDYFTEE